MTHPKSPRGFKNRVAATLNRTTFVASSFLLLIANFPSFAAEPDYYDSLRLVAAMREDELILQAFRATSGKRVGRGEIKQDDVACLDTIEFPEVTDIPARRISEKLTPAEVAAAITFFQGSAGREFVRNRASALTGSASFQQLAASDRAALATFKRTSAGSKLLTQRIASNAGAMNEAVARVDLALSDCAYARQARAERSPAEGYCESRPLASADHVCLATYVTREKSIRRHAVEIRVECERDGRMMTTDIENPRPEVPVALRWEDPRRLAILLDDPKMRIVSSSGGDSTAQRYRFASRQAGDPPAARCLPKIFGRSLAAVMPVPTSIGAWRSYRSNDACLMTARVRDAAPDAKGATLLHFRQQKSRTLPFASTSLVFAVQLYEPNTQVMLSYEQNRLELIEGGNQQMHMLDGRAASTLVNALRTGPLQITAKSADGKSYSIPVSQEDAVFALTDFDACVKSL